MNKYLVAVIVLLILSALYNWYISVKAETKEPSENETPIDQFKILESVAFVVSNPYTGNLMLQKDQ